ncbi:translation initiation factor IF-2 [Streptococcus azizii]|uniref:Translation initiation factor IF-2 n=1 Tax=Streptococcus azizii TaxID=1579424 RepID=A0AB36JRD6_9STRE|nr:MULTISPECIES: translation initiation factor IF-2 [Streptococcus]MBF0776407.1 translation initiation factor IF-2 [Streptococcus sp. 19428wD3_AN2]ONK25806.1 translation initiation factor IF-2 [Streptococcus azizii]ONK30550.1 translation initiation factor IF-2 [Streptococcus azizii]ONK30971.1 translation initiation factor IF-2 [Streptococcus azizii]TFU83037.1 translation initiation factor IF-2 [Streptococcus sp. AN2]
MSKKRLYELAKELGKESKEVVAKAKELGIEVKSHSSSVEAEIAQRIVAGFSEVKKRVEVEKGVDKVEPAASKKAEQGSTLADTTVATPAPQEAPNRPKSRNFKAEREARAKEQAAKRNQRNGQGQGRPQGNRSNGQQKPRRDHNDKERKPSRNKGFDKRSPQGGQQRPRVEEPRVKIDFKARAAALKAEQLQEYARTSEERFRQAQEAKKRPQKPKEIKFEEPVVEAKPKKVVPVAVEATPATDKRRKKQARPDKRRDDFDHEEDGPRKQQKNRNSQNQVRNQRNSNWNPNKKHKKGRQQQAAKPITERKFHELPTEFEYTAGMTVAEIAKRIKREPAEIVKKLFMMGVMATQNQSLDGDTIELLMVDYGIEAKEKVEVDTADIERFFVEEGYLNPEEMVERPPVVTIMGHVDHGKTTLLDTLRNSRVATGEAGGITQHIGAYQIEENGKKITFLDTPGHAAFTSMRARGASVTDLTILVVAADDGVMPQTIEAINHSKAANVPIIVAINKIDKPGANPERVIGELAEQGVISTAWGGDCEFVEISAKFNQNIDELLETVLLVAEIQELKADPTVRAIGTVIEAHLDKGRGAVATLLVQQGTLNVQDPIVVGNTFGRVRAMTNDLGRRVKVAGPSTPVSITGLNEAPMAGDHFAVYEDEKSARAAGEERAKRALLKQRQITQRVSLENLFDTLRAGEVKSVNVIIKADVQGSVEALASSLQKIEVEGVRINIVHSAVGAINESDVTLAEASNAFIIGFSVRPTPQARQQAEADDVEIRLHSIIYKVIEEMEDAMKGMLDPEYQEKIIGEALIRETFKVSKVGTIGGFMVINGKVTRDSSVRVIRDGVVIFDGKLASLKHFKDDVKEITNGREGGLMIENYNDLKVDDVIEAYIMEEIKK